MKELEEKFLEIIKNTEDLSVSNCFILSKACTATSLQYTIDVLTEISGLASEDRQEATINKIEELTKQLNKL